MTRPNRLFGISLALCVAAPKPDLAQTAPNPGYFMPPPPAAGGGVIEARPVPDKTPLLDRQLSDTLALPAVSSGAVYLPWYDTDWGVAAIGIAATGLAFLEDRNVNRFVNTKLDSSFRRNVALRAANILELAPLALAGLTMVQSRISDPELAHASSIAVTAAAAMTAETFALKYAIGRNRPSGQSSNPFIAHPFDASRSGFSIGAVFPGSAAGDSSFPSGNTALAFALMTPYAEIYHAPWLYAIPVAVGLGRIAAVDGHWESDVVGGGFLGWLTADLTRRFFPNSDYGFMIFGDGQSLMLGFSGRF
jgi:membrane-associated phospholipid phosphatase